MIQALTRFVVASEAAAADFETLLARLEKRVPNEPGNVFYKVFVVAGDATAFYCFEGWETQEGFDGHLLSNEENGVNAEAADLLVAPPQTTFFTALRSI